MGMMGSWSKQLTAVLLLVLYSALGSCENILGEENTEFDFDGLPGAQHEFKVDVPGSREECFFQPVSEGASFHVSFQVLKGGDKRVDFYVRNEFMNVIEAQSFVTGGSYTMRNATAGVYAVCIDNAFSRFGKKLAHVSIVSYVPYEWIRFQMELKDIRNIGANITETLNFLQEKVTMMKIFQSRQRFHLGRDHYMMMGLNSSVLNWSLALLTAIFIVAGTQVYTVRRFFRTVNVTPTSKPRA